jgi:hypothetical protein
MRGSLGSVRRWEIRPERSLVKAIRARGTGTGTDASPAVATGLVSVIGVTLANGADNISVYTPVFRTIGAPATGITIAVFAPASPYGA